MKILKENYTTNTERPRSFTAMGGRYQCDDDFDVWRYDDGDCWSKSKKVEMWPEFCVALGPRCYSLTDHPNLIAHHDLFSFFTSAFEMPIPSNATSVTVNCSADFETWKEVVDFNDENYGLDVTKLMSKLRNANGWIGHDSNSKLPFIP